MQVPIVVPETIRRELNHSIDVIVLDQVLANLLLRPTPGKEPPELTDRGGAIDGEPMQHMHRESKIPPSTSEPTPQPERTSGHPSGADSHPHPT